ncbi:MAG: response regulator [Chitinophagales bacterium]|nr:response regulator [Chitinophagales bacterium]MDW8418456.1 response regulator [Chitinophagales bacterium]
MLEVNRQAPYRLFVIEDNPAEVRLMQEAIKEASLNELVTLEYAYDGEEACEVLDTAKIIGKNFDLVLLDLNMPRVTGKEVLEKIKTDPDLETTPVIVVTNSDYKKDMIECYRLRADGYLQKPADFKKLVDFFVSVKRSITERNKLSIYYIEKVYDELRMAV